MSLSPASRQNIMLSAAAATAFSLFREDFLIPRAAVLSTRPSLLASPSFSIARSLTLEKEDAAGRKKRSGNGDGQRKRCIPLLDGRVPALLQSNRQQEVRIPFPSLSSSSSLGLVWATNNAVSCWFLQTQILASKYFSTNSSCSCVGYFRMLLKM
jgi:hypothetical protein